MTTIPLPVAETDPRVEFVPRPTDEDLWVIWSHEHLAWWRPNQQGYTEDLELAGRYTKQAAMEIVTGTLPYGIEVPVPARSAELSGTSRIWGMTKGLKDIDLASSRVIGLMEHEPSSAPWVELPEPIRYAFSQAFARDGQQIDLQRLVLAVARYIGGHR